MGMRQTGTPLIAAVRELLEPTAKTTGIEFFRGLSRGIAKALGVKAGFVGALIPTQHIIRTRAVWWADHFLDDFEYVLTGTPCENVVGQMACFFTERVQELFPSDEMLVQMGIHSYLGVPINGVDGAPLGILVALHDAPTPQFAGQQREELEPIFQLFADRAGLEIERLAAAERLEASEARYRHIVSSTREGVWLIDPEGRTTFANAQMADMLGWPADEMIGRPLHDFIAEERRREANVNLERRASGISERHEFCFRRKDGTELWTIMSTSPLTDEAGNHVGGLAVVADLTEVRALERKIVQSQKLESLGILAGGVAHDFNNLLTGIVANVGFALAELPATATELRSALTDAATAGRRATELTRQMLAYSGRGRFVVQRINFNQIVKELTQLLRSVISRHVHLRIELAPDLPDVDGDATQLGQVVMNLITNASDALDGHEGVVTISTGVITADFDYLASTYLDDRLRAGDYVYVEVVDTGIGMDEATRMRIFDPFFTTKFTGRGLGLAAVLGILRGHAGAVKVDSEPGKGTTFRILLPCSTSTATPTPPRVPESTQRQTSKLVLVADDEALVLQAIGRVLESNGFRVLLASDGKQAISIFADHAAEIDLVLLDLTMPGISGDDVLRRIRQLLPTARVVLSSGYDEASVRAAVGSEAVSGFLSKPWSPDQLLRVVHDALVHSPDPSSSAAAD